MKLVAKTIYLFLALILAAMSSLIFQQSQNFLIKNLNWYAYNSVSGPISRGPIAGNQLNLSAVLGYPELLNRSHSPLRALNFSFQIPDNSFLEIVLNSIDDHYFGVRLSRSSKIKSGSFDGHRSGKLKNFQNIENLNLGSGEHLAEIYFFNGTLNLKINGSPTLVEKHYTSSSQFGFKSDDLGAAVYSVEARDVSNEIIPTSLFNHQNFSKVFTKMFFIIFLTPIVLVLLIYRSLNYKVLLKLMNMLILLSAMWYSYDLYYLSKNEKIWSPTSQSLHYKIFKKWADILGKF